MAGTAAARALKAPAGHASPHGRIAYRLARPADEGGLRTLLRENPFEGDIRLSFECEPDAIATGRLYGPVHQTLVACDRGTDRIVAMALRAERDVYVNGRVQRVGYLGQLRVDAPMRRRPRLLAGGFELCRTLHRGGGVPGYLVAIVGDNRPALRLLVDGRLPGSPALTPLGSLVALAIPARQGILSRPLRARRIERGHPALARAIADCLGRSGVRHQLAPVWTADDLLSGVHSPGLRLEDFFVRLDGDRVTGCAALWDQRAFRQAVVHGYSPRLARLRPLINLASPLTGTPGLPPPGTTLPFAFLSHFAVDGDDPGTAVALVEAALLEARRQRLAYLVLGLAARHPLADVMARRFRHRQYVSGLYVAHWPDGGDFVRSLDGRICQPEAAIL